MLRRGYQPIDYLLLLLLSAIWGSSFLFIKLAVASIPPMTLVAARLGLAALALLLFLAATGRRLPRDWGIWRGFLVVGVLGNVIPFFLINWGEVTVDSSLAAILLAVLPLATVVLAHAFTPDERLTPLKGLGVTVGFAGIVVLVGPDALTGLGREAVSQLAIAGAACCYAVTTIFVRRSRLLATTDATFVSLLNYMAPVFGVSWGALLLGEPLGLDTLAALGLIMIGLGLTQVQGRRAAERAGS